MAILEPLQDAQLSEGQDAHFRCRLSRASGQEAHWALGGVPLQANEMNDITVEHGTLHWLTLHKVVSPDRLCPAVLPGAFPPAPPRLGDREVSSSGAVALATCKVGVVEVAVPA